MFELNYTKHKNNLLFETLEKNEMTKLQNYIPIYNHFFSLNETNYNNINLNQKYSIHSVIKKETDNKYYCKLISKSNNEKKMCFFKFSPLLDPVKYMVGKYEITNDLLNLPKLNNNSNCHKKILDNNNSAYVDGFFSYLTSQLLHKNRFCHGLDFFGSFIGVKKQFKYDIFDDLDYLSDSKFFHKHKGNLFHLNGLDEELFSNNGSEREKPRLKFGEKIDKLSINKIDDALFLNVFKIDCSNIKKSENLLIYESDLSNNNKSVASHSSSSSSSCSSRSSVTEYSDIEEDGGSGSESDSSFDSLSTGDEDEQNIVINNFPVNIICLESLHNTFDSLMSKENSLTIPQWKSFIFQIIITLITYQELFDFTHNDLHTNNIMYEKTDKKYIYYKYNKIYYKVPTFGRIYKIIDFGRAIYKFNDKIVCSDSFHPKGDAATQYNMKPYLNKKKPRLEPNYSFDLCRLACSLYDFFVPVIELEKKITHPIGKLVIEWCRDDNNVNILYKKNGDERYPDFKLYKMIARKVHKHTPKTQIKREIFNEYIIRRNSLKKKTRVLDIDKMLHNETVSICSSTPPPMPPTSLSVDRV